MMNERAVVESTGVFGVLQHIFCSPGGAKVAGVGGWGGWGGKRENHGLQNQEQFAHSVRLKRSEP